MDKIKTLKFLKTKDSILLSLLYSLAITIVMCLVFCVFTYPQYESDLPDDQFMVFLVSRVHKGADGLLIFQNIVYNKILLAFYNVFPNVNWYVIFQLTFMLLAITEISYVIFRKSNNILGILVNCSIIPIISYLFIHIVQFTRAGALISIGGIILAFYSVESKHRAEKIICVVISVITVLFGSWIRFDAMNMTALVMSTLGISKVLEILFNKKFSKTIKAKQICKYVVTFAIVFSLSFVFNFINYNFYHNDNLEEYSKFNELRAVLYDGVFPEYDENVELYQELGISENDLKAYHDRYIFDLSVFTNENLQKLVDGKIYQNGIMDILHYFKMLILARSLLSIYFYIFILAVLLSIYSNKKNLKYIILQTFIMYATFFYLYYIWRPVERALIGVQFAAIISILYSVDYDNLLNKKIIKSQEFSKKFVCTVLSITTALSCGFVGYNIYHYKTIDYPELVKTEQENQDFYEGIAKDTDHLYIYDVLCLKYHIQWMYGVYEAPVTGSLDNILPAGDWYLNWPTTFEVYSRYGVKNVFEDCINNDNIYFVSWENSLTEQYIKENYNENAHFELVKTIGEQNIYKVVA